MRAANLVFSMVVITIGFALFACTPVKPASTTINLSPTGPQNTPDDEVQTATLVSARASLDEHRNLESIALLDKVIAHYEGQYASETRRIYCGRTQTETLFYLLTAASDGVSSIVIGPNWAVANYMKAFALIELGKVADARVALERAQTLSPSNSQILGELGYSYQIEGNVDKAFATFVKAEEAAEFSPDDQKTAELTRALRGQGYLLTEQGHLDESEAKYRKCLEIDPHDEGAKRELAYIAKLRSPRGGGGA